VTRDRAKHVEHRSDVDAHHRKLIERQDEIEFQMIEAERELIHDLCRRGKLRVRPGAGSSANSICATLTSPICAPKIDGANYRGGAPLSVPSPRRPRPPDQPADGGKHQSAEGFLLPKRQCGIDATTWHERRYTLPSDLPAAAVNRRNAGCRSEVNDCSEITGITSR